MPRESLPLYLRLFFGCLLVLTLFRIGPEIVNADFSRADFLWPVAWLRYVYELGLEPLLWVVRAALAAMVLVSFAGMAFLHCWWLRLCAALLSFFLLAIMYSFGKIDHGHMGWPICAFFLAWCRTLDTPFWQRMNARLIWAASSVLLSFYFLSGLSKVLSLVRLLRDGSDLADLISGYLPRIIGLNRMIGSSGVWIPEILTQKGYVTGFAFLAVLGLQLCSILPIFRPRWFRVWGGALICFHLATAYVMDENFRYTAYLIIVLLVAHPLVPSQQSEGSSLSA